MYYTFIIKQLFIILFSFTILVESNIGGRYAHASGIVKDRLFIISGQPNSAPLTGSNDVYFLDLTKPFDVENPPFTDITKSSGMPLTASWACSATLKDGIILFGGFTWNLNSGNQDNGENSLYLFNTTTNQWTIPTVNGRPPVRRREMKILSDSNYNLYIYGGVQWNNPLQWFMDMYILDTLQFRWETAQMNNAPDYPRADYTATMLPSGVIVYIGGRTHVEKSGVVVETELNITQIILFDTKDATWYPMITGGQLIDNRNSHSAVLTSDGKIIIYGGAKGTNMITATPSLAVLDTSTSVYTWSVPKQQQDGPPPLILHTADLYGDYMIVSYGNITNNLSPPTQINSNIYMLNTKSFTWVTSYTPTFAAANSSRNNDSVGVIIGIVCTAIALTVIGSIVGWLLYRKYMNKLQQAPEVIPTPGSDMRDEFDDTNRESTATAVVVDINDNENNENQNNYRYSSNTDTTLISQQKPSSIYKGNTSSLSPSQYTQYTQYTPHTSIPSTYYPHGGIGPNSPPYGSRN